MEMMEEVEIVCNAELFFSPEAMFSVRAGLFRITMSLSLWLHSTPKSPRFQKSQSIFASPSMTSKDLELMLATVQPSCSISSWRIKTLFTGLSQNMSKQVLKDSLKSRPKPFIPFTKERWKRNFSS